MNTQAAKLPDYMVTHCILDLPICLTVWTEASNIYVDENSCCYIKKDIKYEYLKPNSGWYCYVKLTRYSEGIHASAKNYRHNWTYVRDIKNSNDLDNLIPLVAFAFEEDKEK